MLAATHPEVLNERYEVGALIGRGGMGDVHRAVDLRLGRDVAVKFLRPELAAEPMVRQRFEDEARSAARLTHPNVVLVLDSGEHDEHPYLVMECLPGRTLQDEIAAGPLEPARVRALAADILAGLAAAHELGIVHRDIKPANILLTDDGVAKIADFGIAKSVDGLDRTVAGEMFGTPSYLAPERLAGAAATPSADVYAVGVVLYEALTGNRLFVGDSPAAVAHAVMSSDPPLLAEVAPGADPMLRAAIETAITKDPGSRFVSAGAMRDSLEQPDAPTALVTDLGPTRAMQVEEFEPTTAMARPVVGVASSGVARLARDRWVLGVIALVALAFVFIAVSHRTKPPAATATDQARATTVSAPVATSGNVPGPLADAIDRLDKAVHR